MFDQTKFKAASDVGGAEVKKLITIGADTDNWDGSAKQTKVELKAYASKAGMEDSEVVTLLTRSTACPRWSTRAV